MDALEQAYDSKIFEGGPELKALIDGLDHCVPKKVGEVALDGKPQEVYQCPSSVLSGRTCTFIF